MRLPTPNPSRTCVVLEMRPCYVRAGVESPKMSALRILVVEDDPDLRENLAEIRFSGPASEGGDIGSRHNPEVSR